MKVLLLGAGASKPAGYPLASELMDAIEQDAHDSGDLQLLNAWRLWEETKSAAPGPLRLLLEDSNPEVMLSLLDLCSVSKFGGFPDAFLATDLDDVVSASLASNEIPSRYFKSLDHKWLSDADVARRRLIDSLITYFLYKHHQDLVEQVHRRYLRPVFQALRPEDVVITLNWDTLAERTLAENKKWNPRDGYGFQSDLRIGDPFGGRNLSTLKAAPSEVVVLKLHGSIGWCVGRNGIYFGPDFLDGFELAPEPDCVIRDNAQPLEGDPGRTIITYPTYLKSLADPVMRTIWSQADRALRNATEVEIWGYSLPESDAAIRVLLNCFRDSKVTRAPQVLIHVPDAPRKPQETDLEYEPKRQAASATRDRWQEALGSTAKIDRQALG